MMQSVHLKYLIHSCLPFVKLRCKIIIGDKTTTSQQVKNKQTINLTYKAYHRVEICKSFVCSNPHYGRSSTAS